MDHNGVSGIGNGLYSTGSWKGIETIRIDWIRIIWCKNSQWIFFGNRDVYVFKVVSFFNRDSWDMFEYLPSRFRPNKWCFSNEKLG